MEVRDLILATKAVASASKCIGADCQARRKPKLERRQLMERDGHKGPRPDPCDQSRNSRINMNRRSLLGEEEAET